MKQQLNDMRDIPKFQDFYDDFKKNECAVNEIRVSMGKMETKFDNLSSLVRDGFKGVHERQDKTNGNVSANTMWRYFLIGALAIITTLILPVIIPIINNFLSR